MDTESIESEESLTRLTASAGEQVSKRKRRASSPIRNDSDSGFPTTIVASATSASIRTHYRAVKRKLRGQYNDEYRQLLNSSIQNANNYYTDYTTVKKSLVDFEDAHIGMTLWTKDQKHALFNAIERYGRDNLPQITAGTKKSEPEVLDYLHILRDGLSEYAAVQDGSLTSLIGDIPAAVELSEECCKALERSGEALAWHQESWEVQHEKEKHGDYWLLDREVASGVDRAFSNDDFEDESRDMSNDDADLKSTSLTAGSVSGGSKSSLILDAIPAAKLLNLSMFLELSACVFMTSTDPEYDWRTCDGSIPQKSTDEETGDPHQGPSILNTAFGDFHRLAISLTRRLAHVAISQATARLRATDSLRRNRSQQPAIQRRDVLNAVRILGFKEDSVRYWATLPRRSKHRWVYNRNSQRAQKRVVTRQEAETRLSTPLNQIRPTEEGGEVEDQDHEAADMEADTEMEITVDEVIEDGVNETSDEATEDESIPFEHTHVGRDTFSTDTIQPDGDYDLYLEQLDANRSMKEERALWTMLGREPPSSLDLESVHVLSPPETLPSIAHGGPHENWRDWTEPSAAWEILVPASESEDASSGGTSEDLDRSNGIFHDERPDTDDDRGGFADSADGDGSELSSNSSKSV
ncbi:hypothetical protein EJ08DRAFT_279812 [Tothia fuscella]|uniref:Uncharacterized protein n=1 Tax=Tothia fuscella TaxID=1048955 RepID=A0A9P4TY28_9PEZI|nr:hypothetical protein EJ08DRAFT_279812 [Tothia fuscella]